MIIRSTTGHHMCLTQEKFLYLLSLLEPTGRDCVAFLVFYQLLWRLHELMTHITLIHSCDQVNLQVSFKHSFCFADKIAENTFKSCKVKDYRTLLVS